MVLVQVFLSACPERPGWYVILQKDTRARRIIPGALDPMIGVEESEGERSLVWELEEWRRHGELHVRPPGLEIPATIVDALPRFEVAPANLHRMPI